MISRLTINGNVMQAIPEKNAKKGRHIKSMVLSL